MFPTGEVCQSSIAAVPEACKDVVVVKAFTLSPDGSKGVVVVEAFTSSPRYESP